MPDQNRNICFVPLQIGVGFAVLMPILNLFLVLHLFSPVITGSLFLLPCIFMWRNCYSLIQQCSGRAYDLILILKSKKPHRIIPLFLLAFTLVMGLIGLASPSTSYDSTVYHLTLPKLYVSEKGFVPRPDILQSRITQNLAGVHAFCYQWGGEGAIEFLNMIMCTLMLWLLTELLISKNNENRWNIWSIVIVCSSVQFIFYLYDADVEGWLAFLTLCLFTSVWLMNKETSSLILIIFGLLGGCLIGIKPTSFPPVIVALLFGFIRICRNQKRVPWENVFSASVLVIFLGAFWYVIIFCIYGDLYGADLIGDKNAFFLSNGLQASNIWISLKSVIIRNSPIFIYILLIPNGISHDMEKDILIVFIVTSFCIFITNPWGHAFVRYIYPIFPLVVLGIVCAFIKIETITSKRSKIMRLVTIILLFSSLLVTQAANVYRNSRKVFVALRLQDRDTYLSHRVNTYKTIQMANSLVPTEGMLFMVGERSYWLDVPYILGISRNPSINYDGMTPDGFFDLLKSHRVTHVLFSDEPSDKTSDFMKFWTAYPELKDDHRLKLLYHDVWNRSKISRNSYLYEVIDLV
jgi:hypothetical protein